MRQPAACAKWLDGLIDHVMMRCVLAVFSVMLASCGGANPSNPDTTVSAGGAEGGCSTRAYPEIGGPITLTNHLGQAVTEETYKGQYTLIFFGFTYCPDVCPTSLVTMKRAFDRLPEGMTPPQALLVSVDPERDTPEQLATYISTSAFPENLVGLTGSEAQIRAAADAFFADYSRVDQPESLAEYTMDHSTLIYLMDEDWQLKTYFTPADSDETMATCLAELLQ